MAYISNPFAPLIRRFREINQRYDGKRLEMSRPVKITLLALRIYLLVLVALMVYSFITKL